MVDGRKIRAERELLGLTQVELSEKTLIAQPHISAYEKCIKQPSVGHLGGIAKALGKPMDYFMLEL